MPAARHQTHKATVEMFLDEDTVSDQEMDDLMAGRIDKVDAQLQEAYDQVARGECARMEPLHVLLAQEREFYALRQGKS